MFEVDNLHRRVNRIEDSRQWSNIPSTYEIVPVQFGSNLLKKRQFLVVLNGVHFHRCHLGSRLFYMFNQAPAFFMASKCDKYKEALKRNYY